MSLTETKPKKASHRSPSYPMFSLGDAIEKARTIYREDKRVFTTPDVIARHLGFTHYIGGPGGRTMSALRQYGLLEENAGNCRISDRAYTLVHFPAGSPEWEQAAKEAIREPNLFKELLVEYGQTIPSDAALHSNLLKRGFNPEAIEHVIKVFRETVALDGSKNVEYPSIQVGDYVQWESQGALQFTVPKRITHISEDGTYAFFDGSQTGVALVQLAKVPPPEESEIGGKSILSKKIPPKPGMNQDVFTLAEGDVVLQWPNKMSPESYGDFKDWIELITRKAKRAIVEKTGETNDD